MPIAQKLYDLTTEKNLLTYTVTQRGTTTVILEGKNYPESKLFILAESLIPLAIKIEFPYDLLSELTENKLVIAEKLYTLCHAAYVAKKLEETVVDEPDVDLTDAIRYVESYTPYKDHEDPTKRLVYNEITGRVSATNYDTWEGTIKEAGLHLRKLKIYPKITKPAVIFFNPHESTDVITEVVEDVELYRINLYIRPDYREQAISEEEYTKYLDKFKKFMEHLIPAELDRTYCYYWIYYCLTSRMQCYLFLKGRQGTGKTDFAEIIAELVGRNNYTATKNNFLSTEFNAFVDRKQLAYADEIICKKEEHREAFKKLTNDTVQVEGKGQNQRSVNNFCSFLISANQYTNINIHPDDRRFSIIKTTEEKPDVSLGQSWYSEFRQLKNNPKFLKAVHRFILTHDNKKYDSYNRLINHEYEVAVVESANKTLKKIYDFFGLGEKESEETELYYSDVKKKLDNSEKRFLSSIGLVREHLESFTWEGHKIFKVKYDQEVEDHLIERIG